MQLDQPEALGLPSRDFYLQDRDHAILAAYETFAVQVAILLGADPTRAETEMRQMVDFEIELANVSVIVINKVPLSHQFITHMRCF